MLAETVRRGRRIADLFDQKPRCWKNELLEAKATTIAGTSPVAFQN